MPGMNSFFCSSVPHCRIVGPTRVSPKKSARSGAPALANSSLSTTSCKSERPLPPYSAGQPAQIHPPEKSVSVQDWLNSLRASSVIAKSDENQPSGRFSSSQARTSPRNASASSGYVRSIDGSVAKAREVLTRHLCRSWNSARMKDFAESESWPVQRSIRQSIDDMKASWARSKTVTTPAHVPARPAEPGKYRVAFLVYRGNPRCGGQGVYTRHLTRELVRLGHSVEVFSGPPWPELDEGVGFTAVRGLDLYRDPDPFRIPALSEFTSLADVSEFAVMMSAGFGEPLAYSMRIEKILASRRGDFDIIHDDQCMGPGILKLHRRGWPLLETLHHPITVDRSIALDHAETRWQRFTTRRC